MPSEEMGEVPMATRRHYHNRPPKQLADGAPYEAALAEFSRRVQALMAQKGWNQSELARQAAKFMPNKKFNRDNISVYIRGQSFPGALRLHAIAKALGTTPEDLVPKHGMPSVDEKAPALDIRTMSDGNVWVRINQAMPMDVAMELMALIRKYSKDGA